MSLRTPLAKVRGLGSAKEGTHHFWMQRLTAIALVPLTLWCAVGFMSLAGADYATAKAWVSNPVVAVLLVVAVVMLFHHAQLGLQVVIEDYVHIEWVKVSALIAVKFAALIIALLGIVAVLRVAIGG
jgi:succinate dehydrogenase / fumarate reductase, membrane anchor subunit